MKNKSMNIRHILEKVRTMEPSLLQWQIIARSNAKVKAFGSQQGDNARHPACGSRYSNLSEQDLLHYYRHHGNSHCLGELYRRYGHLVLGSCIRYLGDSSAAEDAVSEIFLKLVVKLRSFTPRNFAGWLYAVTRNHCLEVLRKEKTCPIFNEPEQFLSFDAAEEEPPAYIERETVAGAITAALKRLPARQRTCVEAFYLLGMSYRQVAERHGMQLKEVKSHIQNGKRNLRKYLGGTANRPKFRNVGEA